MHGSACNLISVGRIIVLAHNEPLVIEIVRAKAHPCSLSLSFRVCWWLLWIEHLPRNTESHALNSGSTQKLNNNSQNSPSPHYYMNFLLSSSSARHFFFQFARLAIHFRFCLQQSRHKLNAKMKQQFRDAIHVTRSKQIVPLYFLIIFPPTINCRAEDTSAFNQH